MFRLVLSILFISGVLLNAIAVELNLTMDDTSVHVIDLAEIHSLSIEESDSTLQVHLADSSTISFILSEIRKVSFSNFVGIGDDELALLEAFDILRNYPNPFNSNTTIEFNLPKQGLVSAGIFNVRGQLVCTLFEGVKGAGQHKLLWNGESNTGSHVSSGIYFCRVNAGQEQLVSRMLLLK